MKQSLVTRVEKKSLKFFFGIVNKMQFDSDQLENNVLLQGRLNELMSQLRMQNQMDLAGGENSAQIDSFAQHQICKVTQCGLPKPC